MTDRDFKSVIVSLLEDCMPEFKDKIQAGAVDAKTPAPFAVFSIPEERVIRTLDGVAGSETTFEVSVYDSRFAGAEKLRKQVIACLDDIVLDDGKTLRHRSSVYDYFPDYNLHSVAVSFRIV